jgi:23S rRNA (cytidine1920-2'-O)/16S rRNA (cytidine1409-2'-O)-methyltransferase
MLVKPQFELQPGQVGKGGIVTDPAMFGDRRAAHPRHACEAGLQVQAFFVAHARGRRQP